MEREFVCFCATDVDNLGCPCNQCDFASSRADALRTHLKTHSGEKSNKCNQCDFVFLYISALRKHLKMHSGEKPNKYNQCDFAPSQAGHLRAHLKTHSLLKCNSLMSMGIFLFIHFLSKVTICCQKLTNVANCCCQKILFLIGYYLLRANGQGKTSRGQNVLAQNFTQDKMLQDRMSPNHSISLKD